MIDDIDVLTPEEREAAAAVRGLRMRGASSAFRDRLQTEFMTGSISSGLDRSRVREVPGVFRFPARWVPPLAWAAAATLIAVTAIGLNRGPAWQVKDVSGSGIIVVGNLPIPLEHSEQLAAALLPGARVRVPPGATVEVMAPGNLAIVLMAGTDVEMPASPGRWFGRGVSATLAGGQLRITTGPRFKGARLAIHTPEADVAVTGTTLAVICEPQGTCICVLEGHVDVGARGGEMSVVDEGRRRFVFNDGRGPEVDEMRPTERERLGEFRDSMDEALRR